MGVYMYMCVELERVCLKEGRHKHQLMVAVENTCLVLTSYFFKKSWKSGFGGKISGFLNVGNSFK